MRKKENRLIFTFPSTVHAMKMEKICKEEGHPGRIIPVPRQITAGCGLAWSAPPDAGEELCEVIRKYNLVTENQVMLFL